MRSQVSPGEVRAALPPSAPESGEPFSAVLADLDRVVLPGVTHWQHPGFFGYFPANTSGPSVLGDLVSAGLGVQGMSWVTSPAATELEQHVLDWFADLLGPPGVLPVRPAPAAAWSRTPAPAPTWSPSSPPCTGPAAARPSGTASTRSAPRSTSRPRPTPRWRRPSGSPGSAATPSASSRSTATSPCARRPGRPPGAGRRPRLHPGAGLRHGRDDVDDGRRPARRARADLPEVRRLAARGRRLRRG